MVTNADGSFALEFNCKQTPMESSRITLSNGRHRHVLQRAHIASRNAPEAIEAKLRAFYLLRSAISDGPSCRLEFDESKLATSLSHSIPVSGHHIANAPMAAFAILGVINTGSAVFDLPNLYIARSTVFSTSSPPNPTLNIVALIVRFGDHVKATLGRAAQVNSNMGTRAS